jgi:hypothetical protein
MVREEGDRYDVAILIPTRGMVSQKFANALASLQKPPSNLLEWEAGHQIDTSRNLMVSKAMSLGAKSVFFLDSDVIPPQDALMKLIAVDMPVVSGAYFSRAHPYHMMAKVEGKPLDHNLVNDSNIHEATEVGMGCCLIDIRVFHRIGMALPWRCMLDHLVDAGKTVLKFTYAEAKETKFRCPKCKGALVAPFFQTTSYDDEHPLSEDYYFCKLVREAGFPVVVKTAVACQHELTGTTIGPEGLTNSTQVVGEYG